MKIGPFTPPDVREAILWEQENPHALPLLMLPNIYLNIAGFTVCIAQHEGYPLNFVDERVLAPFLNVPLDAPDFLLITEKTTAPFPISASDTANVSGEMTDEKWVINSVNWLLEWNPSQPHRVVVRYLGPLMTCITALRLFLAHQLLAQKQGVLLHASAAARNDKAFVFLGHSGAGKSTSVYHAPCQVLADETVAIIVGPDGKYTAMGTPFGGEHFPSAASGPNPTFFFVEKSNHNARKSLSTRNAVARMLSQIIILPFAPVALWNQATEIVEQILENHTVEILEAKKDGSFWKDLVS